MFGRYNIETLGQPGESLDKERAAELSEVTLQTFWENTKEREESLVWLDLSESLVSQLDRISPRLRGYNIKVVLIGEETDILKEEPLKDEGVGERARLTIVADYPTFERVKEEITKTNGGDLYERGGHVVAEVKTTELPFNFADLEIKSPKSLRIDSDTLETVSGVEDLLSLQSLDLLCHRLVSLPKGIGGLTSLTELKLYDCRSLVRLPEGIGHLTSLTKLKLYECRSLVSLPERIGDLKALTELNLYGCTSLVSLPEGIGDLTSLTKLDLKSCKSVVSLPERIGDLKALTELNLGFCSGLVSLPERIGRCESLTHLNLQYCKSLVSLPDSIGDLKALQFLSLERCTTLESLPKRFGELTSLRALYLYNTAAGKNMPEALKAQLKNQGCSGTGW